MASGWAHFRKVWLKPEVYPLIGAMAAALGVMTASLINKARHPTVAWNKGRRGTGSLVDDVDEVVPLWSDSKKNSTSIFGADSSIIDSKALGKDDLGTYVVKAAAEEEEEEEEADEQPEAPPAEPAAEEVPVVQPILDVIDESAEAINAAVDAAIETANDITPAPAPPASAVEAPAAEAPVEDTPVELPKAA
ncbi:hypothetical protein FGB62_13g148 [Gracilaria domingensis]|nr:hypothetical protein FGB62_13g148 [Gracilaria domingensis]